MENLLPALPDALARGKRKPLLSVATGFGPTAKLHVVHAFGCYRAGAVLDVLGQCLCCDADGDAWRLLAYVPASAADCTSYATRQAKRFPEVGQVECWFQGVQMFFAEIDITDYADCLALEAGIAEVTSEVRPLHQPAAGLRKAA